MLSINWAEIAVADLQRAKAFYTALFGCTYQEFDLMGLQYAHLVKPDGQPADIALVQGQGYAPAAIGTVAYLGAEPDMDDVLARVPGAGGQVLLPKTDIGPAGFMAWVQDTEGNRIGLHHS